MENLGLRADFHQIWKVCYDMTNIIPWVGFMKQGCGVKGTYFDTNLRATEMEYKGMELVWQLRENDIKVLSKKIVPFKYKPDQYDQFSNDRKPKSTYFN